MDHYNTSHRQKRPSQQSSPILFFQVLLIGNIVFNPFVKTTNAFVPSFNAVPLLYKSQATKADHSLSSAKPSIPFLVHRSMRESSLFSSTTEHNDVQNNVNDDNSDDDDDALLESVGREHLVDLCTQCNISTDGTKSELLAALRKYAQDQAGLDEERKRKRRERVEQGFDDSQGNGKAKHKIVSSSDADDGEGELDGYFYFGLPGGGKEGKDKDGKGGANTKVTKKTIEMSEMQSDLDAVEDSRGSITAPPPPPNAKINADGERVVTVYSSSDQNDLTGAAAQSASTIGGDVAMMGGNSFSASGAVNPEDTLAGGPFGDQSGSRRRKASAKEMEEAKDAITELAHSLLAMTGAPGFQDDSMLMENGEDGNEEDKVFSKAASFGFVGFDPSRVPTTILTQNSKALRVSSGEVLMEVMTDFEMRAIGLDGRAGDDKDRGGGHYLEVQKVTTFLEGFRKAEVRKVARETATMLLDKLVSGGVKGLDEMLMTMTRGEEDSSEAGELNDSLIQYLEEAIRQQEIKVEQINGAKGIKDAKKVTSKTVEIDAEEDFISSQWNVTVDKDGEVVESLDPNDPEVKKALERQLEASKTKTQAAQLSLDPAEQLLTLLVLLKERVKAEALFANDEKGRNLRVLAYCMHAKSENERETIIMDRFGSSLDQLDSFSDLLVSSIDYAKSTSHQLQPSKSGPLDIRLLQSIKDVVDDIKDKQAWKATGISS